MGAISGGAAKESMRDWKWLAPRIGVGLDVVGTAFLILLENNRWVAWVFLLVGTGIIVGHILLWAKEKLPNRQVSATMFIIFGAIIGGLAGYIIWKELPSEEVQTTEWLEASTPIVGKYFRNETVELDGKKFVDCKFENVTFHFLGKGDFLFVRPSWKGVVGAKTEDRSAKAFYALLNGLAAMPGVKLIREGMLDEAGGVTAYPFMQPSHNPAKDNERD